MDTNSKVNYLKSTLALLVPWVCTNYTHNTVATNNFAITADFLDRCLNSHGLSFTIKIKPQPRGRDTIQLLLKDRKTSRAHYPRGLNHIAFKASWEVKQEPHVLIRKFLKHLINLRIKPKKYIEIYKKCKSTLKICLL